MQPVKVEMIQDNIQHYKFPKYQITRYSNI